MVALQCYRPDGFASTYGECKTVLAPCPASRARHLSPPIVLRRLLALAALLLPFALSAQAADSLQAVHVRVLHDGAPVAGAVVRVAAPSPAPAAAAALTNGDGRAALQLPLGEHALVAGRIGFDPETLLVTVAAGAAAPELTFELEEAAEELEEIVIASTRTARRVEDEPLRVEVLPREEIEEKLLMTPGDISMMLNETGGLRVQATAPSLGGAGVRVQGMRGRYTQVLADGLPLHGETGSLGLLQIPPIDLGQVEIIKGPASALYGSAALGGVINLISRRPERARELLVNGSTRGATDVIGYLSDTVGRGLGYSTLLGAHRQRINDVDGDGWADVPGYERGVLRQRLFWSGASGASAFITAGGTLENREGGTPEGSFAPDDLPFRESQRTRRYDAGTVLRLLRGRNLVALRGSTTLQRHRHRFDDAHAEDRHRTAFAEASWTRAADRLSTVLGVAFQREEYDRLDHASFFVNDIWTHDFRIPGVFAQLDVAPTPWLAVSASARFDAHSEYGRSLSPRVSALLRPGAWTVRASAGGGVSGPSPITELVESVALEDAYVYPPLGRERAWSGSLDVGRFVGPLEMNVTFFRSRVEHPLIEGVTPGSIQIRNARQPLRAAGGELLARYRRPPLAITGTYAFTDATEPEPLSPNVVRPSVLVPRHTASLVTMLEEHDVGRAGLELHFTGEQPLEDNPYRDESRPYLVVGLLLERRFGRARVFVNGENLLDARQTRWDPLLRPERDAAGRWITDAWAPLDGRNVNGGVRFSF